MFRRGLIMVVCALVPGLLATGLAGVAWAIEPDMQRYNQVELGRYLVSVADCTACHSDPGGGAPFAGGRSIETPFGNIRTPNITPDVQTGIGAWTDEQFDDAVRRGIGRNGARLYPAMPYPSYTKMSRDEVLAIRSYLKTITPARNAVEANTLPFPFNIRTAMRVWDGLFFTPGEFKPDPQKPPEWNRGAYLVQGPGHCGACHTPKNFLGGDKGSEFLRGSYLQGWFAPDLTNDEASGLGRWSVGDIVSYLHDGHNAVSGAVGPMAEEVMHSSSQMHDEDLKAIATYLKSLPGKNQGVAQIDPNDPAMRAGEAIYRDVCSACHGIDRKGVAQLFPSLADSAALRAADPTTLIRLVLRGSRSVATDKEPTAPGMPSFGWQLDDAKVAAVLTYLRNAGGPAASAVTAGAVKKARRALEARSD